MTIKVGDTVKSHMFKGTGVVTHISEELNCAIVKRKSAWPIMFRDYPLKDLEVVKNH